MIPWLWIKLRITLHLINTPFSLYGIEALPIAFQHNFQMSVIFWLIFVMLEPELCDFVINFSILRSINSYCKFARINFSYIYHTVDIILDGENKTVLSNY